MRVLAGDIGGTKTLLCIVDVRGDQPAAVYEARFRSREFAHFDDVIARFLLDAGEHAQDVARACLGVAGPVRREQGYAVAEITNLPWRLDSRALSALTGIAHVDLINDFEAIAYGVAQLAGAQLHPLQGVLAPAGGTRLIVGAGTGLGVAVCHTGSADIRVSPSQGGHLAFAPADALDDALLAYWRTRLGRVSWEHLVAGPGLVRLYEFLRQRTAQLDAASSSLSDLGDRNEIPASADPAAAIAAGADAGDTLCMEAVAWFVRLYGCAAGELALVNLPYTGVYLAGGIAPKLLRHLIDDGFMEAFRAKGPMSPLMQSFPVAVILEPRVGVIGAGVYAARQAG